MKQTIDAFNYAKGVIIAIIEKKGEINKSHKKFMQHLFELFLGMRGRYNFVNLSRYGSYCEQSYRNNFVRKFDFLGFNKAVIEQSYWRHKIIAFDPSYISKSGKHTDHIGYFAKAGFIDAITGQADLEVISKLRIDADLKYLYNGLREKRRGAPRKFDGKVNVQQPDKRRIPLQYEAEHSKVYSGIVWSTRLKREIKIAYVEGWKDGEYTDQYAVLFSTDLELDGLLIYQYYKSRFQIEFLYRDAKQQVGLNHCQARDESKLYFHRQPTLFNTSLTTVSLAKAVHYLPIPKQQRGAFSMEDIKTFYANKIIVQRIFSNLDLDLNCKKIRAIYHDALFFGRKAA